MRLSLVAPVLAVGLLCGWAVRTSADVPPAAPIFYCPTPSKAPPAASAAGHGASCPTSRAPARRHRRHPAHVVAAAGPATSKPVDNDVSASQAFIYRYELALHGLNARAAHEAWAGGAPPPCPVRCPMARNDALAAPPPMARGRVMEQPPGPPPEHRADVAPPAVVEHRDGAGPAPPPPPVRPPPPAQPAYGWEDRGGGAERVYRSERSSGWSYTEEDGRGHFERWGDGDGRHWMDHRWRDGRHDDDHWGDRGERWGPCPPVRDASCAAGFDPQDDPPPGREAYTVAGRDAQGFLTWPGKTPEADR